MTALPAAAAKAFLPIQIGPLTLRNRFIKSGANEGAATADGLPSKQLAAHHRAMAAGGVAMTTVAYTAVSAMGRSFANQLWLRPEATKHFRAVTDAVHSEGAAASIQITHGGSFTFMRRPGEFAAPSASTGFNEGGALTGTYLRRAMRVSEIEAIAQDFAQAALEARDAGFDAVEIHMGHGYLLSQFLTPSSNRRRDQYGGDAERRARFGALVVERVRDAVGDKLAIVCKMNVVDGHSRGLTAKDAAVTAQVLERAGAQLLVLSGGRNVEAPWVTFGSPFPIAEMRKYAQRFLERVAWRLVDWRTPKGPFKEMYFRDFSNVVRAATKMPLAFIGGVKSVDNIAQAMDDGFDCIVLARVLIHDPEILLKFRSGAATASGCNSCNRCIAQLWAGHGTSCVFNAPIDPVTLQIPAAA
jgi:2,4-dienoyl-CoA reductase-like NADH-dependent reductase (Old Yellow Enzyme family)